MADGQQQKVTVGCRVPAGIELQLFRRAREEEQSPIAFVRDGAPVALKGTESAGAEVKNGVALNRDVDQAFFQKWLEQNASSPLARQVFVVGEG